MASFLYIFRKRLRKLRELSERKRLRYICVCPGIYAADA